MSLIFKQLYGNQGRGLDSKGRADADAEIGLSGVIVSLGQLIPRQFLPEIDYGVMELPLAVLAVPTCEVLSFLAWTVHLSVSSDCPETADVLPPALHTFLQIPISMELGNGVEGDA